MTSQCPKMSDSAYHSTNFFELYDIKCVSTAYLYNIFIWSRHIHTVSTAWDSIKNSLSDSDLRLIARGKYSGFDYTRNLILFELERRKNEK